MSHHATDLESNQHSHEKLEDRPLHGADARNDTNGWTHRLLTWGVELRGSLLDIIRGISECSALGIQPVPLEQRTDTQFSKIFFIWLSMNVNILS